MIEIQKAQRTTNHMRRSKQANIWIAINVYSLCDDLMGTTLWVAYLLDFHFEILSTIYTTFWKTAAYMLMHIHDNSSKLYTPSQLHICVIHIYIHTRTHSHTTTRLDVTPSSSYKSYTHYIHLIIFEHVYTLHIRYTDRLYASNPVWMGA